MRLRKVLRLIGVVGGFVLVSDLARAQVSHAQINGTVRDASGAVVPDATIVLRNTDTGVEMRAASNEQGVYILLDHHFGQRDIVWGRYSGSYDSNQQPGPIPAILNQVRGRAHNFAVSWVHTFSPSTILQVQSARVFVWTRSVAQYRSLPTGFIQQVGYSANILTPYVDGKTYIPNYSPAGFFSTGESMTLLRPGDSLHHKAGLSKLVGNHTLKFGGEHNWIGWYYENGVSSVSFQPAQTADPLRLGTTGSPLASFLLDVPDAATRRDIRETTPRWAGVIGFYFQDSWKASDRLTINLGLRYDRTFIPTAGTEAANNNKVGDMDFNTGTYILQKAAPPCAAVGKPPCIPTPAGAPAGWLPPNVVVSPRGKIYRDTTKNFQPRLGIAYRLSQRTAIPRAFFFDNYSGVTQISRDFIGTWPSLGWQSVSNLNYPTSVQVLPVISATNPLPSAVLPEAHPFNQVGYIADPNWRNGYSIQWNAGFQHQLFPSTLITMNYVGSGTHRTTVGGPYGVALYPGPGNWRDRAPFRHMPIPISWDRSWGNANYHALQASLERRWARGLAFTTSYTWSKSIDYGHSEFFAVGGAGGIQNPYNMRPDRGVSSYDLTHNLVISWVYNLPLGQGRSFVTGNRFVDYILGNWQVNGIADLRSGMPINLTVSGDIANIGSSITCGPTWWATGGWISPRLSVGSIRRRLLLLRLIPSAIWGGTDYGRMRFIVMISLCSAIFPW